MQLAARLHSHIDPTFFFLYFAAWRRTNLVINYVWSLCIRTVSVFISLCIPTGIGDTATKSVSNTRPLAKPLFTGSNLLDRGGGLGLPLVVNIVGFSWRHEVKTVRYRDLCAGVTKSPSNLSNDWPNLVMGPRSITVVDRGFS